MEIIKMVLIFLGFSIVIIYIGILLQQVVLLVAIASGVSGVKKSQKN